MPKTTLGKWSVGLILAFFIFFGLLQLLINSGQKGGETFTDNLLLAIPGFVMAIAGVFAFFTGLISIVKNKERSIPAILATVLGFFILISVIGISLLPPL